MANKRFKRQEYAMAELEDLNPATDAARISASIGKRKKDLMLEKASELGIKVLNK